MKLRPLLLLVPALLLAGCEIPGLGPDPRIAQREADGRAIGAACRHALRGIEDCYNLNAKASKTAVFEGWKEMDAYMRENKIEGVTPKVARDQGQPVEEIVEDGKQPQAAGGVPRTSGRAAPPGVEVAAQRQAPAKGH